MLRSSARLARSVFGFSIEERRTTAAGWAQAIVLEERVLPSPLVGPVLAPSNPATPVDKTVTPVPTPQPTAPGGLPAATAAPTTAPGAVPPGAPPVAVLPTLTGSGTPLSASGATNAPGAAVLVPTTGSSSMSSGAAVTQQSPTFGISQTPVVNPGIAASAIAGVSTGVPTTIDPVLADAVFADDRWMTRLEA